MLLPGHCRTSGRGQLPGVQNTCSLYVCLVLYERMRLVEAAHWQH